MIYRILFCNQEFPLSNRNSFPRNRFFSFREQGFKWRIGVEVNQGTKRRLRAILDRSDQLSRAICVGL
jgi:hypothetical protein